MSVSATEGVGSSYFGATAGTSSTNPAGTGTAAASGTDQMDKDMFLKLMVAQLKNQDPMNPTDSSQFLAQTAQFTSLEKLDAVASQTAQALTAQMAFGASGLVGRTVTYTGADGAELTGTVGSVRFTATGPMLGVGDAEVDLNSVTKVAG
jgi:flagellar basal-body rod modification protein FlgD